MRLPPRAAVIAEATAMQESGLVNRPDGTSDSLGRFQQRPSQGWGTPAQIMQPVYAATRFYQALAGVPGWQSLPLTVAARAVQGSGLVMMAYRAAGVVIPRTSQEQWAAGPWVPPGHEQPGDLVFFAGSDGIPQSPGHVGLVIGDGEMIEAYAAGYPIRISTYGLSSSPAGDQAVTGFTGPAQVC
jgi:NlpC/P60 family